MDLTSKRNHHGFTLAELLIAMLIFSFVVSLTYAAFTATFRVIDSASTSSANSERIRVTMHRITEDLESLHIGENFLFEGSENSDGDRRADSLSFTSRAHLLFHKDSVPAGYATISYSVEEGSDGNTLRLYRQDRPFLPGDQEEAGRGFLLCDGLQEVAFTYLDTNGTEFESWDSVLRDEDEAEVVPVAVRILLGFPQENKDGTVLRVSTLVAISQGG